MKIDAFYVSDCFAKFDFPTLGAVFRRARHIKLGCASIANFGKFAAKVVLDIRVLVIITVDFSENLSKLASHEAYRRAEMDNTTHLHDAIEGEFFIDEADPVVPSGPRITPSRRE